MWKVEVVVDSQITDGKFGQGTDFDNTWSRISLPSYYNLQVVGKMVVGAIQNQGDRENLSCVWRC